MERGQGKGITFTFSPLSAFISFILHIYQCKTFSNLHDLDQLELAKSRERDNKLEPDEMHRENSGLKIRYKS